MEAAQEHPPQGIVPALPKLEGAISERFLCRNSFIAFIAHVAPWFIIEEIHLLIADALERMIDGKYDRLMVFMPPRSGKTQLISQFFPAWYLGRNPEDKVLQVSYAAELASDNGRWVRDMVRDPIYQGIFPNVELRPDVKAAGRWMIRHGQKDKPEGIYYAAGVTGGIAGRGWNLGIIDDPLSEQDAISDIARQHVRSWYAPGFYTRRQPERNMAVLMSTRWAADDLPAHLLDMQKEPGADKWHVLEIPAILTKRSANQLRKWSKKAHFWDEIRARERKKDDDNAILVPEKPIAYRENDSYAPRRWPLKQLLRTKANMTPRAWSALYQQQPVEDEGHILKRASWRKWTGDPPECFEIVAYYDTAIEEDEEADFSARTTWGLFEHMGLTNVILIEAWHDRVALSQEHSEEKEPGLLDLMVDHAIRFDVDRVMIEKRASGSWLVKEARRRRVPARPWLPPRALGPRNKGKVPRAHFASIALDGGCVWYVDRLWAHEVIDECANVPFGAHDDLADTVTMALIDLRERWKLELKGFDEPDDDEDEDDLQPVRAYG